YGGLNFYEFRRDGSVTVEPVLMDADKKKELEDNLMMFYTGQLHSASAILKEQGTNITAGSKEQNQLKMCTLARELREELTNGNIDAMGEILHENWLLKKTLASGISNIAIDEAYEKAIKAGAIGGKLLGAGGGGFLLFYVPQKKQEAVKTAIGLPQMPMRFDKQGSVIIFTGEKA
ncbi:MAG: GHMP kinase, partial [Clostridia bacterium]|nr:GHMP kinase [Clostridia bacterium]